MKVRFMGFDFEEDSLEKVLDSYVDFMCDVLEEDLREEKTNDMKAA